MQPITKETVRHLAELAQINVDDDACERMASALQDLGALTRHLSLAPYELTPTDAVAHSELREDVVQIPYPREVLLSAAPEHNGETFSVPRTVED